MGGQPRRVCEGAGAIDPGGPVSDWLAASGDPPVGWTITAVEETGSTNDDLLGAAAERPHRSVLVADHQTAGRGRLDRRWDAPPGANLLVSLLFHAVPDDAGELVRRVSLAAVDAARAVAPEVGVVSLKWPNDVLLDGRKLAGVLAQRGGTGAVVVGIGINVGWAPADGARLGPAIDRRQLLAELLAAYDRLPPSAGDLMARYRRELATIGQDVRVTTPGGELVGVATGVTDVGQLVVVDADGRDRTIDVADVSHVRPA